MGMQFSIKKGLDIPLAGAPSGPVKPLDPPSHVSLNLTLFPELHFRLLIKPEEHVKRGQPLLENKNFPGHFFVSPAAGKITEIRRGLKRVLQDIIIQVDEKEEEVQFPPLNANLGRDAILQRLLTSGVFSHIRRRPFHLPASPKEAPRAIFISALESAPFMPSSELQIQGEEEAFKRGLSILKQLTEGKVHLFYREGSTCPAFHQIEGIDVHSIKGPHPSGLSSVHIHLTDPIRSINDVVWTLRVIDVIAIGKVCLEGIYYVDRILGIGGEGIKEENRHFYRGRLGYPVSNLMKLCVSTPPVRCFSGDPLMGREVKEKDYLGFADLVFSSLFEKEKEREFLHFFRFGRKKYSAHRAYLSGFLPPPPKGYVMTTSQHGEERPFIDHTIYDQVMPLPIPTAFLIKALLAEDFEKAEALGLLEVAPEDFALPSFICPSKIEMVEIVQQGIHRYAKEMGVL